MADPAILVAPAILEDWGADILTRAGAAADHARLAAAALVRADLRGIATHGVTRLPVYCDQLLDGRLNPAAAIAIAWRGDALVVEGDRALGPAAMRAAAEQLYPRARERGIATAFLHGVGHLGAIGLFALEAAEAGLVMLLCQQTPPLMALEGSSAPLLGNNPIAFAAPVAGGPPLLFDTALSVAARGRILAAVRDGTPAIPGDWAIDAEGRPTTDPAAALAGSLLPIAGYKGMGFAMLVQLLAGTLTGTSLGEHAPSGAPPGVGAFALVIAPEVLLGPGVAEAELAGWLDRVKTADPDGRYPGMRGAEIERRRRVEGIALPPAVVDQLRASATKVGAAIPPAIR